MPRTWTAKCRCCRSTSASTRSAGCGRRSRTCCAAGRTSSRSPPPSSRCAPRPTPSTAAPPRMAEVTRALEPEGVIRGWRDEPVSISHHYAAPELLRIERAATRHFGMMAYGAHLNGFTRRGGEPHLWIARRAAAKSVDPDRLDNLVGGRIASRLHRGGDDPQGGLGGSGHSRRPHERRGLRLRRPRRVLGARGPAPRDHVRPRPVAARGLPAAEPGRRGGRASYCLSVSGDASRRSSRASSRRTRARSPWTRCCATGCSRPRTRSTSTSCACSSPDARHAVPARRDARGATPRVDGGGDRAGARARARPPRRACRPASSGSSSRSSTAPAWPRASPPARSWCGASAPSA